MLKITSNSTLYWLIKDHQGNEVLEILQGPFRQPKDISELKQLRRRQLQKTIGLMIKTTALHVHHAF